MAKAKKISCGLCSTRCRTSRMLIRHQTTQHHFCKLCNLFFEADADLAQHATTTGHEFCTNCHLVFENSRAHQKHGCCGECQRFFKSRGPLKRHQRLTGHCYCGDCDNSFPDSDSLARHKSASDHASEFRCCDCNKHFHSTFGLERHLSRKKCQKKIENKQAKKKREKKASKETRKLPCIGSGCTKMFKKPSGMILHLESGACPSGMARARLNNLVLAHDVDRLVSKPEDAVYATLLEATKQIDQFSSTGGEWTPSTASELVVLTPPSGFTSAIPTPALQSPSPSLLEDGAVAQVILQSPTRCPLCPTSHRPFSKPSALQMHLDSAAHAPRIFHCPVGLFRAAQDVGGTPKTCRKKAVRYFKTISGLAQHVETGACKGGKEGMLKVIEYIEGRLMELGMEVKLLM